LNTDYKRLFIFIMILCSVSISFAVVRIYVEQPSYYLGLDTEVTVSVRIEGMVEQLRGFEMFISFDPDYLEIENLQAFSEGDFLSANGETQFYAIGSDGNYMVDCAILGVTPGSVGDGTLFSITLSTKQLSTGPAGTDLAISGVVLRDVLNQGISVDVIEGCNIVILSQVYEIPLSLGWNLLSSPVMPGDADMLAVFAELINEGYLLKVQDETGNALVQNTFGDWVNNLGDFEIDEGYYVKVNADCILYVYGEFVTPPLVIELQPGWNIISYPYLTPQDALDFLQPLMDSNVLVKAQNESGAAIMKNSFGVWVNNIGNFITGEGYYIKVNAQSQITYP
jgi:hypothetical protein